MNYMSLANSYAPFLSLVVIGYCLARWANLSANRLYPLIRFVFLPVIIFSSISNGIAVKTLTLIIVSGAAVTAFSIAVFSQFAKRSSMNLSPSAAFPNVAYFTLPLIALVFGSRGVGTASAFLIGSYLAYEVLKALKFKWKKLVREPIVLATILGIIVASMQLQIPVLGSVMKPLYNASFSLILIYLGTSFCTSSKMNIADACVAVFLRISTGFLAAFVIIKLSSVGGLVAKTIMLCALAPSGTPIGKYSQGKGPEKVGAIVYFLVILMNHFGMGPWDILF